jgi:hypothetical protein
MLTRGVRLVVDKVFKVIHLRKMKHSISHIILWSFVMYLKDTQRSVLPGLTRKRNLRSKI